MRDFCRPFRGSVACHPASQHLRAGLDSTAPLWGSRGEKSGLSVPRDHVAIEPRVQPSFRTKVLGILARRVSCQQEGLLLCGRGERSITEMLKQDAMRTLQVSSRPRNYLELSIQDAGSDFTIKGLDMCLRGVGRHERVCAG